MNLTTLLLFAAIAIGSLIGIFTPSAATWLGGNIDYTLLGLVGLLFFGVPMQGFVNALSQPRVIFVALFANFVIVPLLGYGVASVFLAAHPLIVVGLVVYFMSPCTDWFLSFTRMSGGNVALGTALMPINMACQLLLYPFFLEWFTLNSVNVESHIIGNTLLQWFLLPLIAAVALRLLLQTVCAASLFEHITDKADRAMPLVTALLVLQIFADNASVILTHLSIFAWVLLAVFTFFALTFLLGEGLSRIFKLNYADRVLLSMTIAARNAPLMLAVTMAALPEQPLIYSALIIGMLVEFPHLTLLRRVLISSKSGRKHQHDQDKVSENSALSEPS